jgi:hypothetical protein
MNAAAARKSRIRYRFLHADVRFVDDGHLARLSGAASKLYWVLCARRNGDNHCHPSIAYLSTKTGLCKKSVRKGLAELEAGIIAMEVGTFTQPGKSWQGHWFTLLDLAPRGGHSSPHPL